MYLKCARCWCHYEQDTLALWIDDKASNKAPDRIPTQCEINVLFHDTLVNYLRVSEETVRENEQTEQAVGGN